MTQEDKRKEIIINRIFNRPELTKKALDILRAVYRTNSESLFSGKGLDGRKLELMISEFQAAARESGIDLDEIEPKEVYEIIRQLGTRCLGG